MRRLYIGLVLLLILGVQQISAELEVTSGGTISGTIQVWRSRAKTEGNRSYKDVVVFLERVGDGSFPVPTQHVTLNQKDLVFIPHVLAVQKGTTVDFLNSDNVKHNVYFLYKGFENEYKEELEIGTWSLGDIRSHTLDKPGVAITLCKLHLEMAAYIVVLDTPYFAVAAINGETQQASYTIKNVPPGKYMLKAWHKKLKLKGESHEVTIESGKTTKLDIQITRAKYAKKK